MPRTSTRLDISIPSPLSEAYLSAQKEGKVRPRSEVCTEALESELRRAGIDPPPRPEGNPRTEAAARARWAPKPPKPSGKGRAKKSTEPT